MATIAENVKQHEKLIAQGKTEPVDIPAAPQPVPPYASVTGMTANAPARGPVRGTFPSANISDVDFAASQAINVPLRSPIFPVQPPVTPNNLATKTNLKFSHAPATNAVPGVGVLSATQTTIPPTPNPVPPQPIGNPPVVGPRPTPINPSPGPPGLQKIPLQSSPVPVSPRTPIGVTGPTNNPAPIQSSPTPTAPRLKTTGAMTLDQISPGLNTSAILQSRSVQGVAYNYRGVWSEYLQYLAGDEVVYQTSYWKALTSSVDSTPGTGNADWQVVGSYSAFEGAWNSGTAYAAGAEVTYNGNFWVAVTANTNSAPSTSNSNWQIAGPNNLDDVADGTYHVRSAATNGVAINIQNGNFTSGTAGWYGDSNTTINAVQSSPLTNGMSLEVTTSTQYGTAYGVQKYSCNPGDTLYLSYSVITDGTFTCAVGVEFYDGSGNYLSDLFTFVTSSSWATYTKSGTAPSNTAYFILFIQREDSNGGSHYCNVTGLAISRALSLDNEIVDGSTYVRPANVNSDHTFHVSTPFNNQGNLPAISYGNTPFTFTGSYNSTYATKPCALLNWGAISNQLANGSSAGLTAATTMYPVPSAPTVTTASGGSFAANTYSFAVGIVYQTPSGINLIYSISPQTTTLVAANDTATIDSPSSVSGALGWVPLVGLSDVYLSSTYINVAGNDIENVVSFGTNVTLSSWSGGTGYSGGLANLTGYSSGSGGSGIYYFGLATNTTYYCYPYFIVSSGVIITNSIPLSAKSYLLAAEQSGDGNIALTNGSVSLTTPSSSGGSGGSTGSPGGGRGLLVFDWDYFRDFTF